MKKFYLLVVLVVSFDQSFGTIRNGYEPGLEGALNSLHNLNMILIDNKNLTYAEKLLVKSKIEKLVVHISLYELTDEFIRQFKIVAPVIFTEIDNIKDKQGRYTDVFIKLVPEAQARTTMVAATFFEQMGEDEDASASHYGPYSVSVDIHIVDNALFLLSHELGHISYIVPNLAEYTRFYSWHYRNSARFDYMGHTANDPSGQSAHFFERRFIIEKKIYAENGGKKPMSLAPLLTQIKRNNNNQQTSYPLVFALNVE